MADLSGLDAKYFVTGDTYNCPYCNRHSVKFEIVYFTQFDWSDRRSALAVFIRCQGEMCGKVSMHLTNETEIIEPAASAYRGHAFRSIHRGKRFDHNNLDQYFFYSQPTAFFTIDERIPRKIRDLVEQARNSRHSGFLVGGSACLRKAIYELLAHEGTPKDEDDGRGGRRERDYRDRVRDLKAKREHMDPTFVDVLAHTLELTSDQLHEDSWDGWTPPEFDAVMEATMSVLREMYVVPEERKVRAERTAKLIERMKDRDAARTAAIDEIPTPREAFDKSAADAPSPVIRPRPPRVP